MNSVCFAPKFCAIDWKKKQDCSTALRQITKGSLGYLSSMYFSTSLVLGEVGAPFPEIESRESRTETWGGGGPPPPPFDSPLVRISFFLFL